MLSHTFNLRDTLILLSKLDKNETSAMELNKLKFILNNYDIDYAMYRSTLVKTNHNIEESLKLIHQ